MKCLLILVLVLVGCVSAQERERRYAESEAAIQRTKEAYFNCLGVAAVKYAKSGQPVTIVTDAAMGKCSQYYRYMEEAIIEDLNGKTSDSNRIVNLNNGRIIADEVRQEFRIRLKQFVVDLRMPASQ